MTSFKASDALEPLEYDFKPYADAKGTVPEPTDDQVARFYADQARNLESALGEERLADVDMEDPVAVGRLLQSLNADDYGAMYDQLLDTHAAVCSDQPTREEVAALPFRLRRAWYGMVQGWLRPESSRPATDD